MISNALYPRVHYLAGSVSQTYFNLLAVTKVELQLLEFVAGELFRDCAVDSVLGTDPKSLSGQGDPLKRRRSATKMKAEIRKSISSV